MKTSFPAFFFIALAMIATPARAGESGEAARILQTRGTVTVGGIPAAPNGIAETGKPIVTGHDGSVLLGLAAGQYAYAGKDTTATVAELNSSPTGAERVSVVRLDHGTLHSHILPPKSGTTAHKVVTPFGELKAKGTAWSTAVGDGLVVVSYSGTVVYTFPGIGDVNLTPGCVATLTGAPADPVLTVVDLVTGRVYIYRPGQPVEEKLADASDLAGAAKIFEDGVLAFLGTATDSEQLALGLLISQINQLLVQNHVVAIGVGRAGLWPAALTNELSKLSGVASPERPNP